MEQKEIDERVKKFVGRKVVIVGDHPRADEVGIIIAFNPSVGITGKPAFEVEPVNSLRGNFFVFNGKECKFLD